MRKPCVETCVSHAWAMREPCVCHAWAMRESYVSHAWTMREQCVSHAWTMRESCVSHAWAMREPRVSHACAMLELCVSHAWAIWTKLRVGSEAERLREYFALLGVNVSRGRFQFEEFNMLEILEAQRKLNVNYFVLVHENHVNSLRSIRKNLCRPWRDTCI